MSTIDEISGQPKTLLPAKEPAVNPWLQRRLQKLPTAQESKSLPLDSNWTAINTKPDVESTKENVHPVVVRNNNNNNNNASAATVVENGSKSQSKMKPTAKDKWVPYDATIIVDNTENSNNKKKSNKKKKTHKKRQDDNDKDLNKDNKKKTDKKIKESSVDELIAPVNGLMINDSPIIQPEIPLSQETVTQLDNQITTPIIPEDRRNMRRRSSNKLYHTPNFKRSSSTTLGANFQLSMYSPMPPTYLYQPIYQPFFPQPPPNYGYRRNSRHNSSSSSLNETTASPSPPPLNYNKNSEPFFPQQQFMGYYTIPQQNIYSMMPPPQPLHISTYVPHENGNGAIYMNSMPSSKRGGRSQESFTISSSNSDRELEVAQQLDYYFSKENLIKDTFLRSNMIDGYVNLKIIAGFLRFKSLTGGDWNLAVNSLTKCTNVEYKIVNDEYLLKSRFNYFFK